jgi:hypothetical protein
MELENSWIPAQGSVRRDRRFLPSPFTIPVDYGNDREWDPVGGNYGWLPGDPASFSGVSRLGGTCGASAAFPKATRPSR